MRRDPTIAHVAAAWLAVASCNSYGVNPDILPPIAPVTAGYQIALKTTPPLYAYAGTTVPLTLTVSEVGSDGVAHPAAGKTITFTIASGGGTINGASSGSLTSDNEGNITVAWVLSLGVGTQALTGTSGDHRVDVSILVLPPSIETIELTFDQNPLPIGVYGGAVRAVLKDGAGRTYTDRPVYWSTSNPSVATLGSYLTYAGTAINQISPGTTTITATSEGKTAQAVLTVAPPLPPEPVASVIVTLGIATINTSTFYDQASVNTKDAAGRFLPARPVTSWQSSNPGVATISNTGLISPTGIGTTMISAVVDGVTGSILLTVIPTPPPLPVDRIAVLLGVTTAHLATGSTSANAFPKDSTNNQLSDRQVTWQSSNESVATIMWDYYGLSAKISFHGVGTTTITGTCEGKSASVVLTVTN